MIPRPQAYATRSMSGVEPSAVFLLFPPALTSRCPSAVDTPVTGAAAKPPPRPPARLAPAIDVRPQLYGRKAHASSPRRARHLRVRTARATANSPATRAPAPASITSQ